MKKILALSLTILMVLSAFSTGLSPLKVSAAEGYVCTANYYFMNEDMSTYHLEKTETTTVAENGIYSPEVYEYDGFISPKQKSVTADKSRTVNYFYERATYTIDYVADGSDAVPESQKKIFGIDTRITKVKPEKDGYTFVGWSDNENSDKIAYQSGDKLSFEGNLTLYAVWSINTYIVSFDTNGGSECDSLAYKYGSTYDQLPVSEKSGYNFDGWYYDKQFEKPVSNEDVIDAYGDRILYAKWRERKIVSVEITALPEKTDYFVGDTISAKGLTLEVSYDNGEVVTVTSGYTIECDNLIKEGVYEVTVLYEGISCKYNINVSEIILSALEIKQLPTITDYYVDDSLNTSGMVVELSYNNGSKKIIKEGYTAEYDFSLSGECEVIVIYSEYGVTVTDSFVVTVIDKPEVYSENITVEKGQLIEVPVYIRNNSGLMGYHINLSYNSDALSPVSTKSSELFKSGFYNDNIGTESSGMLSVVWTGTDNVYEDGLMFTAYFKAGNVKSGDYEVTITYEEADTITDNYAEVKLNCNNLNISIVNEDYVAIPELYAEDVSTQSGETIQIPIYIKNGEDIKNIGVVISYDEDFMKPLSVNAKSGSSSFVYDSATTFITIDNIVLDSADELLAVVDFEISSDVTGSCNVSISADVATYDTIELNVTSTDKTYVSKIYADEIVTQPHLVTVPICIDNNSGIMGYKLNVSYDNNALALSSVSCGNAYLSGMFTYYDKDGVISVVWNNTQNVYSDDVLFVLNFERFESSELNTEFNISYSESDTFNEDWNSVKFECENVLLNTDVFAGDVNKDKLINLKDIVLLRRYLAGGYDVDININNADVNKDSVIDITDIILIERYLDGNFKEADKWFE